MRRADLLACMMSACALVLSVAPVSARAQSQEEKRRQLQERLGIQRPPSPPRPEEAAAPEAGVEAPGETASGPAEGAKVPGAPAARGARSGVAQVRAVTFVEDARPILEKQCLSCHRPDGMAGRSKWVLRGEPDDYEATLRFVKVATAAQSPLLRKGTGATFHGGKKTLSESSAEYATLVRWIEGGALPGKARQGAAAPGVASAPASARPPPPGGAEAPSSAPSTVLREDGGASSSASAPSAAASAAGGTSASSTAASAAGGTSAPSAAASTAGGTSASSTVASAAGGAPASSTAASAAGGPSASAPSAGGPAPGGAPVPASPMGAPVEGASAALRFSPRVHAQLLSGCAGCHASDGFAGTTRYVAHPDAEAHLRSVLPLLQPGSATASVLYQRARGEAHQAGAIWEQGSEELALLARWIDEGAQGAEAAPAARVDAPAQAESPPTATAEAAPPARRPPEAGGPPPGVSLGTFPVLGTLTLNGRFDLNYERVHYNDQPFQSEGANALRSYHHFLFLTRQSAEDPVTLTLEMLSLQFWEVGYRLGNARWPVKVFAKAGKLLVPFGGDPLFHHSYGGLAGFDQKVLPVVFAREGVAANVQRRLGAFRLTGDAYVIAGYQLRRADAILNLQSDFAPLEETRLGAGTRLGASWGPLSLWYSAYYNPLGHGRRLFLQAVDVVGWRPRGLPILERFSLGAGLLRADVSGGESEGYGGPGADYYHFASYLQLRFHPTEWLYVQYRQGVRTFGNRRGVILDTHALTRDDASSHNVGVVARWGGLSAGLFHFWNLEKVDEVPDDFTRLVVAYDF